MAKRPKKKARRQKIAENGYIACRFERTPKKLIRELNEMVMDWDKKIKEKVNAI